MKTPGDAAMGLRWIAPGAASLTMLARQPLASVWPLVRTDPGVVLLFASLPSPDDVSILEAALSHQNDFDHGFVDWSEPRPAQVRRACCRIATLAERLAQKVGINPARAWLAGFLAPLGSLATAVAEPARLDDLTASDHSALVQRLVRTWRLPGWLTSIISRLELNAELAERLGADRALFQVIQLAVATIEQTDAGLGICLGVDVVNLQARLGVAAEEVESLAASGSKADLGTLAFESPAKTPLLVDFLQLALEQRRRNDAAWIDRLQEELDRMQSAIVEQSSDEKERLQSLKLSALAEFAAGAGHEINNPLAVISGQAQYALKQIDWLDVPVEEIEDVGTYLENLRNAITPSLDKIIGQTHRIHAILKELMHFARPHAPKLQTLSLRSLVVDVASSLQPLAHQRKVRVLLPEWSHDEYLHADPVHVRTALAALLRNAIEATPADGWAAMRVEKQNHELLRVIVEDSGSGPAAHVRDAMFDPFFSGRAAGRGRGMGLPTAWRLAKLQGGDVRFEGHNAGVTRFVLTLPLASTPSYEGPHAETRIRHAAHSLV